MSLGTRSRRTRALLWFLLGLLVVDTGVVLLWRSRHTRGATHLDVGVLRSRFTASLDARSTLGFLTTGTLNLRVIARLPRDLVPLRAEDRSLLTGDTVAVRVPGTVWYGLDITALPRDSVTVDSTEAVSVSAPPLRVGQVRQTFTLADVDTGKGWLRVRALDPSWAPPASAAVRRVLRDSAEARLARNGQPRAYAAHLLLQLLANAARAAGDPRPRLHFHWESDGV